MVVHQESAHLSTVGGVHSLWYLSYQNKLFSVEILWLDAKNNSLQPCHSPPPPHTQGFLWGPRQGGGGGVPNAASGHVPCHHFCNSHVDRKMSNLRNSHSLNVMSLMLYAVSKLYVACTLYEMPWRISGQASQPFQLALVPKTVVHGLNL